MENILDQQKQQTHPMHYQPQLHHSDALQHQAVAAVLGMSQQHQQSPHSQLSSPYHLTSAGHQSPDIKPNLSHLQNSLGNSTNGAGTGLLPNLCVSNSSGSPLTSVAYHTQNSVPTNSLMYNQNDQFNAAVRAYSNSDFDSKLALNQNLNNLTLGSTYGHQLNSQLNNQLNQFNGNQLPSNNLNNLNNLNTTPNYLTGTGYPSSNLTNCSPVGSMMSNDPLSPNGATRDSMGNLDPKEEGRFYFTCLFLNFPN